MDNTDAVLYVHSFLEKHGVLAQLRAAGVKHGDLVHAGTIAFAFEE
jgi:Obg family GTPase CgtA-like protein